MAGHPHLSRWFDAIVARPAVARDMDKTRDVVGTITDEMWDNLWGKKQFERKRNEHPIFLTPSMRG